MAAAAQATSPAGAAVRDFSSWMAAEQRRVFLLCFRMLRSRDEADSATQDVFLKAYRALEDGTAAGLDEPGAWLTRVAVNACLDRLRSRRWRFWRQRPEPEDEASILARAEAGQPNPERAAASAEIAARIAEGLNELSDRQRAAFVLRHYEDRPVEEIARLLGLDVGTVKAHLARALVKLRRELKDLYALER